MTTTRRKVLTGLAAGVAAPAILHSGRAYAQSPTIKVGFVTPATGPLAGFGEADDYVLEGLRAHFAGGIENNGKSYNIEIIKKDSQSNPNRAAEVAEKVRISDLCSTGLYYFRSAGLFQELYAPIAAKDPSTLQGGERYIAPLYNDALKLGHDIRYALIEADEVLFCGTPDEYDALRARDAFGEPF